MVSLCDPPGPYEVVEQLQQISETFDYHFFEMCSLRRDDNEKQIFEAIRKNDVQSLKTLLQTPANYRLGYGRGRSILRVSVIFGDCDVIKFLIDNGCDVREIDPHFEDTILHTLLWNHKPYDFSSRWSRNDPICQGCEAKRHRLDILEILLAAYSDNQEAFDNIFLKTNKIKMTPFLLACASGCDAIIMRLLSLIENKSVPIDKFISFNGNNLFHYLLDSSGYFMTPRRVDTVRALIDQIQFSGQLIDKKNNQDATPLYPLLLCSGGKNWTEVADLAKMFFLRGASPDGRDRYRTFLKLAIAEKNLVIVDVLLRTGCRTDNTDYFSPLRYTLSLYYWKTEQAQAVRIIELLLAFGFDLQKELYLYTIDERPLEFTSPKYAELRDTTDLRPDVLEALREIRRSNKLLSLQRQCRNTIRRFLKGKADEAIQNLNCIPNPIKSYLLVENEISLLDISL